MNVPNLSGRGEHNLAFFVTNIVGELADFLPLHDTKIKTVLIM